MMIPDRDKLTPAGAIKDIAVMIACVFFLLYFRVGIISGNSMEPTLGDGGVVVYSSTTSELRRGDIVVFTAPDGGALIKRIVGLPGDVISIKGGVVTLNGERLEEGYTAPGLYADGDMDYPCNIPSGHYFVMGDNRPHSRDSRMQCVGLVSDGQILGVVRCVVTPSHKRHVTRHVTRRILGHFQKIAKNEQKN